MEGVDMGIVYMGEIVSEMAGKPQQLNSLWL